LVGSIEPAPEADTKKKTETKGSKEIKAEEPFSKILSRESRDKVLTHKTVSSSAAYYTPKYHHVEK